MFDTGPSLVPPRRERLWIAPREGEGRTWCGVWSVWGPRAASSVISDYRRSRSRADGTPRCSVGVQSRVACLLFDLLETGGHLVPSPEVHLVGRLAPKRGVGEAGVVLLDIELDQPAHLGDGVELVEEQPVVPEDSPLSFDERVREPDLGQGEDAAKQP